MVNILGWAALLVLVGGALWCAPAGQAAQAKPRQVLVLAAGNNGMPWYDICVRAIRETFAASVQGRAVNLNIEYTGLDTQSSPAYMQKLDSLLREKYASAPPDLVIAVADPVLNFLIRFGQEPFWQVPVVTEVETELKGQLAFRANMVGCVGTVDIKGNLDLIRKLHPRTKQIAVVCGAAPYDQFYEKKIMNALELYRPRLKLILLSGLSSQDLLRKLGHLPPRTVILYLMMNTDGEGKSFIPRQFLARMARAANAPIYGLWDTYMGWGIVGGRLSSTVKAGQTLAELALRILSGEKPADIAPVQGFYATEFDWRQLSKWGIEEDDLPPGSRVLYKPVTFWDLYKWHVLAVFLAALLAGVGYVQIRTRAYKRKLRQQEKVQQLLEKTVEERTAGLQRANAELERLSHLDGLTSLHNRRRFDQLIQKEWQRHLRAGSPLSLIMCDLDYFKYYNDTYGHQAGDDCLKSVAHAIQAVIKRPSDAAARYGGEEFALILSNTDSAGAVAVAREIREAVERLGIPHAASPIKDTVSLSCGVATIIPDREHRPETIIRLADQALYQSKNQGRDRVRALSMG